MSPTSRDGIAPLVLAVLGGLLFVAGVGYLLLVRIQQGPDAADPEASVVAGLMAVAGVAGAIRGVAARRRLVAALPATAEQVEQAAATLAELVYEQWSAEAQVRALNDPEPMPVRWRLTTPDLMDHPHAIVPGGAPAFTGSADRIGELTAAFRALPRRRLVITGGPGTGKTTLAVQLLLELLATAEPAEPVPVLLSLASWDIPTDTRTGNRPRVQDWLAAQLDEIYPALRAISPDAVAALVERGRVLPILDGLDEVPSARRAAIITALNASLTGGVILTSRRPEYRTAITDAGDVLTAAATIGPYTLTPADAATYLRTHLPPHPHPAWTAVLEALTPPAGTPVNAALAAVVATPLGLWLVRAVYLDTGRDPTPLTDATTFPSPAALRAHLFADLVPALIAARPPAPRRRRDSPDTPQRPVRHHRHTDLTRWLTTIAEHLRDTATAHRDWRWWRLAHHVFRTARARLVLRLVLGLVSGLVFGLVFGLVGGAVDGLWWVARVSHEPEFVGYGPAFPLSGVVYGLVDVVYGLAGVVSGQTYSVGQESLLALALAPALALEYVQAYGLAGGEHAQMYWVDVRQSGLALALAYGQEYGQEYGLAYVLAVGLAVGLGDLSAEPRQANPRLRGRGRELIRGLAVGLAYGLAVGLVGGPVIWLVEGIMRGMEATATALVSVLVSGLEPGLTVGLLGGLVFGLVSFFRRSDLATRAVSPTHSHRGDRAVSLIAILIVGLLVGQLVPGLAHGLAVGLVIGLAVGLAVGLAGVMNTPWLVFAAAAVWETLRRPPRLPAPWRVMSMLEDCYRLGLLRTVGPVYQFRHAELQDHLAPPLPGPAPQPTSVTGATASPAAADRGT